MPPLALILILIRGLHLSEHTSPFRSSFKKCFHCTRSSAVRTVSWSWRCTGWQRLWSWPSQLFSHWFFSPYLESWALKSLHSLLQRHECSVFRRPNRSCGCWTVELAQADRSSCSLAGRSSATTVSQLWRDGKEGVARVWSGGTLIA